MEYKLAEVNGIKMLLADFQYNFNQLHVIELPVFFKASLFSFHRV